MGTWKEIYGNLITLAKEGEFDVIAHGCNCKKNMGKGIAVEVKKKFPQAYVVDQNFSASLGDISFTEDYEECIVVNAYTQVYPGKSKYNNDTETKRYDAIRESMKKINERYADKHIGLPLIGAGLAGLKWQKVKKILKEELVNMDVTIVRLKLT